MNLSRHMLHGAVHLLALVTAEESIVFLSLPISASDQPRARVLFMLWVDSSGSIDHALLFGSDLGPSGKYRLIYTMLLHRFSTRKLLLHDDVEHDHDHEN